MDICKRLYSMLNDEADAIISYNKLKNEMPPEHTEHIKMIERYIGQEYDHLRGVEVMLKEMGCKDLTPAGEMYLISKEIYEKANEIEKIARSVGGEEGKKIHDITEEIEHKVREIDSIVRKVPMEKEAVMEAVEEVRERE